MRFFLLALYAADPEVQQHVLVLLQDLARPVANQSTLMEIERWIKDEFDLEELEQVIGEYIPRLQDYTARTTDFELVLAMIDCSPPGSADIDQFAADVCNGDGTQTLLQEFLAELRRRSQLTHRA